MVEGRGTIPLHRVKYVSWCADPDPVCSPCIPALSLTISALSSTTTASCSSSSNKLSKAQTSHGTMELPQCLYSQANTTFNEQMDDEKDLTENVGAPEAKSKGQDPSLLCPEDERFHMPRSSPVIFQRGQKSSSRQWETKGPAPNAPSLGQVQLRTRVVEGAAASCLDVSNPRSCQAPTTYKACGSPVSANLNRSLSSGLHLPFREQQVLVQDNKGPSQRPRCSSDNRPRPVFDSKDKRTSDFTEVFKTSCDLDEVGKFKRSDKIFQENAHFIVVDMVLEALEAVKWTISLGQSSQAQQDTDPHLQKEGFQAGDQTLEEEPAAGESSSNETKTLSMLSADSGFEDCTTGKPMLTRGTLRNSLHCPVMKCPAESLAQQLVIVFKKCWFPSQEVRRGRHSLRTSLQELPGTEVVVRDGSVSLSEEIRQRTRMRGTWTWAPPRFQIIFSPHAAHRRSEVVASQHFLCAGCGTDIEPKYIKKLLYCHYLGRYFCDCCHSGSESVVPGRVLTHWDFARYPVSDFSKQLLDSVLHQPLFDLTCVGTKLYGRARELDKFRELQEQIVSIKRLLTACRSSDRVMQEFEQLPGHLTQRQHLFSMDDLLRVKRGQLVPVAKTVLRCAINHVENCQLCLAKGFICEFCRQKDVLFPFQSDTCTRCKECRTCFHKQCFREGECPKCARIRQRKQLACLH